MSRLSKRLPLSHYVRTCTEYTIVTPVVHLRSFPKASLKTFVPPANMANEDTLVAMRAQNLSILSSMGTLGCHPWKAPPPRYNYMYVPCQQGDHGPYCIPPGDVYFNQSGFQALKGNGLLIYSAPTGSANHVANDPTSGLTVNTTLGYGTCGCGDPSQSGGVGNPGICSIIGSAINNAAKSGGLHWTVRSYSCYSSSCAHRFLVCPSMHLCATETAASTLFGAPSQVLMMHPQTLFRCSATYVDWLDELLLEAAALPEHDLEFINFQDLLRLKPNSSCGATLESLCATAKANGVAECELCENLHQRQLIHAECTTAQLSTWCGVK